MKWIKRILMSLCLFVLLLGIIYFKSIKRLLKVISLFEPDKIAKNFIAMEDIFPANEIMPASQAFPFVQSMEFLPENFTFRDTTWNMEDFLEYSQTAGLIVLRNDTILHESYALGLTENEDFISWSVCKSIVSALVGIAVEDGLIGSINDSVDQYAPILSQSGYAGVSIKDVLQMSSGIRFSEDYTDKQSDINKMGRVFALGLSFDEYVASLESERPAGEFHKYVSMDTQVLGMVLKAATNQSLSAYCEQELWSKIGTEFPAYWLRDNQGMEAAFGGFNACLRDYARFGKLYADYGAFQGEQLIDSSWVRSSTIATEDHLKPGDNPLSSSDLGYGYQWWIPENEAYVFTANGVYNQYIYVDPINKIVIVKCSANYHYAEDRKATIKRHFACMDAIREGVLNNK